MLDEARRRHERGEDVIVGAVQGQRSEDVQAILRKLEPIPPLQTSEGQAIDLDAILRRAPQVCVIDPLAAQNPPGTASRGTTGSGETPSFRSEPADRNADPRWHRYRQDRGRIRAPQSSYANFCGALTRRTSGATTWQKFH